MRISGLRMLSVKIGGDPARLPLVLRLPVLLLILVPITND